MEIQNGFIVGVFNYCDRWCETCAFTSRCRLFADVAEVEAKLDPNLKAVAEAPLVPRDQPPPLPSWLQDLIDEMNVASQSISDAELKILDKLLPEHEPILARSLAYRENVRTWLRERGHHSIHDITSPLAVIAWFHTMIHSKVFRAVHGVANDDAELRDWPADYDGSAKVALVGIDRSHIAWLQAVERGIARADTVDTFLSDLVWLGEALEHEFPNARAFVRPAFDEPDEVAKLLASETSP